jgi:serine/threonine protein kinase
VLYECLTGAPPIIGDNDKETLTLVSTAQPKPPSAIRTELSTELDDHLLRLLKKDPQERPSSASELEVELTNLLGNAGPSYTEPDLAKTVQKYFSAEDFSVQTPKENLRSSILQAGRDLHGGETTDELLATKTVSLDSQAKTAQKKLLDLTIETKQREGRSRSWLRVSLLLILFVVTAVFALNKMEQTERQRTSIDNKVKAHSSVSSAAPMKTGGQKPTQKKARRTKERNRENNPVPEATEWGWLNINSYPWSYVSVDGKKLNGHTPYSKIKLPTGAHVLIFENPQLGLQTTKKVTIKAWEESNIGVRLE